MLLTASAEAATYSLEKADVATQVTPSGALRIREQISAFFFGTFTYGYRIVPLRKGERIDAVTVSEQDMFGHETSFRSGGSTERKPNLEPGTFGVDSGSHKVTIVWHFRPSSGPHTFVIRYRFRSLTVAYDDVVDVNLKVWGDQWSTGLDQLTASTKLPRPARLTAAYRVYGHPAWVHGVVTRTREAGLLRAVHVPAHQFVELRVVFPRRLLASAAGATVRRGNGLAKIVKEEQDDSRSFLSNQERIDDAKRHILRTLGYLALFGLVPALAIVLGVWFFFGRERRTGYDREYEQQPPSDLEPAVVPPLLRQTETPGSLEFTATLFDLIRRGYYKSRPVSTQRPIWGGVRHEDVSDLELSPGNNSVALVPFERSVAEVFDSIVDGGAERLSNMRDRIEDSRTENASRLDDFRNRVATAIRSHRWYIGVGAKIMLAAMICFALAAVVLLWVGIDGWRSAAPRWGDIVLVALGGCAIANATVLIVASAFTRLWRRRTKAGQLAAERWDAFRRYLTDFPRLQEAPPATLELWERFLVYGIAFGIAEKVLHAAHLHMPEQLHEQSTIYWISPNGDLGSGPTALAIGDLSSGFGSALTPPSSSGGGGGFSGGGGGGGGGGGFG